MIIRCTSISKYSLYISHYYNLQLLHTFFVITKYYYTTILQITKNLVLVIHISHAVSHGDYICSSAQQRGLLSTRNNRLLP